MLQGHEPVLVAVSGGVDSMTLLHVLRELADDWNFQLSVAHLDHMMRPESADDAQFVVDHARSQDLPVFQEAVNVPAHIDREGGSPEAGAREIRYRFLRDAAHKAGTSVIALGHTLDDRVETLLINLLRGSGIGGLAGMPPTRTNCDLHYIRPLIDVSRGEIEAYAKNRHVPYREDPSNLDLRYERNRIRQELMPLLETFNPSVRETMGRASDALLDVRDYLQRQAERLLDDALVHATEDSLRIAAPPIRQAHRALGRQTLRQAIVRLKADIDGITARHIEALVDLIAQARSGRSVALPDGLRARYQSEQLHIERGPPNADGVASVSVPLDPGATTSVPDLGWRFSIEEMPGAHPDPSDRLEARLDPSTMVGPLTVRNRRPGDRIDPLGLGGTKKVQDILIDAKVPRQHRDTVPLICDDRGPLWVAGHCLSERAKVTPSTRRTLRIRAERLQPQGER